MRFRGKDGFTLVELLVVIGIIALLISILLPSLAKVRKQAVKAQCAAQLRQWGIGLAQYAGQNQGYFPYNGAANAPWCPVGGRDLSWTSSVVQQFVEDFLLKNNNLTDVAKNNVLFCPSNIYHREVTVAQDPTLTHGLLGYFYLPHRSSTAPGNVLMYNPPQNPDGIGWVEKKKFAQQFKLAPIMSDMIQYDSARGWNYFSSHVGKKNVPEGGNFLFEDGHVKWFNWDQVDIGAAGGGWECRYVVDLNLQ